MTIHNKRSGYERRQSERRFIGNMAHGRFEHSRRSISERRIVRERREK